VSSFKSDDLEKESAGLVNILVSRDDPATSTLPAIRFPIISGDVVAIQQPFIDTLLVET
jgi:hypothetical protein